MSHITVSNLTFAYEGSYDTLFENVSFRLDTDWRLGFIGRNGRGKTTFLKLLMGRYEYRGSISASVAFEYFPYEPEDISRTTFDALRGLCGGVPDWELVRELSLLEVTEDALYRPMDTLSGGERTKVMLAALFLRENGFALIDEPTNHLDRRGRELVSRYLSGKRGFILVSHDRAFLDGCVDHVLAINRANIEVQRGNFSSWRENRRRQDASELAENERLKKDIKRLEAAARQSAQWADKVERSKIGFDPSSREKAKDNRAYIGEKSRRMQQRRKNLEKRQHEGIEEKSRLLKNIENTDALKLAPLTHHTGRLVQAEDLTLSYGGRAVCRGLSFTVERGRRAVLAGRNGSGKTSLLQCLLGQGRAEVAGRLSLASGLVISYVPQDTSFLRGDLSDFARAAGIDESLFKAILRKLDFSRAQFDKPMERFSEGQKKKALLARSLCERAHLYIWDEPLNYVDVFSRMQIEALLRDTPDLTLLLVEHDRAFCEGLGAQEIALEPPDRLA
ncbi:MAG: ABC-F type ribosomal protection protein [Oscillospiraceae bacterium]|nr:ABC-F type ribosomal protection protein [Oscillospiraceae bacterium]